MKHSQLVAVLTNVSQRSDRRTVKGVVAYAREHADWDLYIEEDPLHRMPKLKKWNGHGIIVNYDDRDTAMAVCGLKIPMVGFGGGRGWYDPASRIPYFTTDNPAVAHLAACHLLNCGFTRLACYGDCPSRRVVTKRRAGRARRACSLP